MDARADPLGWGNDSADGRGLVAPDAPLQLARLAARLREAAGPAAKDATGGEDGATGAGAGAGAGGGAAASGSGRGKKSTALVFDTIAPLLLVHPLRQVLQFLQRLRDGDGEHGTRVADVDGGRALGCHGRPGLTAAVAYVVGVQIASLQSLFHWSTLLYQAQPWRRYRCDRVVYHASRASVHALMLLLPRDASRHLPAPRSPLHHHCFEARLSGAPRRAWCISQRSAR